MVPSKGLEPPHPCEYMDLNHARLPIPPRWQVDFSCAAITKSPYQEDLRFYSTDAKLCVKPACVKELETPFFLRVPS